MNKNDFFNALIAVGATIAAALNIGIIAMERLRILTDEDYRELSELDSFVKCLSDMI